MKKLIVIVLFWLVAAPVYAQQAYYIRISPKGPSGPSCLIGGWTYQAACRDVLGSLLYAHPFLCHTHPSPTNCANIGNGLAYPRNFTPVSHDGVRVPDNIAIAPQDCEMLPTAGNPAQHGWHGLFYHNDGTCEVWEVNPANRHKYRQLQAQGQGVIPSGSRDSQCLRYPYFFVGSGVGQNDFACY